MSASTSHWPTTASACGPARATASVACCGAACGLRPERSSPPGERGPVGLTEVVGRRVMEYRQLGRSDLNVSEISLGSWLTYGVGAETDAARACVEKAL